MKKTLGLKRIASIIVLLLVESIITVPINDENESTPLDDSSTPASTMPSKLIPCQNNTDYQGVPQLVFPTCTSMRNPMSLRNIVIHGMACTCDINTHDVLKRDDYHYTPGIGAHKLHTRGATFNNARKVCSEEGGHLAIIDSAAEERVLLDMFKRSGPMRNVSTEDQALIGIHDLYADGDWVTILGDSLHKFGYTKWSDRWGGQPDNGGGLQHCGSLLKEGGMDDVNCNIQYAFFCEIPAVRIAH